MSSETACGVRFGKTVWGIVKSVHTEPGIGETQKGKRWTWEKCTPVGAKKGQELSSE